MSKMDLTEMNVSVVVGYTAPRSVIFDATLGRDSSAYFCRYSCTSDNIK